MGVVYEALDVERNVHVALKTILHHDEEALARFKHEFRSLQDIHHPNLVALGELVADVDDVFFTMELVEGVDLRTWIRGTSSSGHASSSPTAIDLRSPIGMSHTDVDVSAVEALAESGIQPTNGTVDAGTFDETRVRSAFQQIALGLSALHAAGKVHRDVKPSNVRVTSEGRVVLLDFGLVSEIASRHETEANIVGTPAYMAPEQASTQAVGPEADWYAMGVMLYESLAGRRPFEGASAAVLMAKHYREPIAPRIFVPHVPEDLDELCMALLKFDPRVRPTGADVLRRLRTRSSDRPGAWSSGAPFVGRARELGVLEQAFADVGGGRAVTVALYGESGVGKSALVRRFFETSIPEGDEVLGLAGRCYEREAVPYKAFDEVVEALSRRLARLPLAAAQALVPADVDPLAQIFPALHRIPAIARKSMSPDRDPLERRRSAFRAFVELLRRISARQRLVITIDDLQWTDADSLALLHEVLCPPDAPPFLLILTVRTPQAAVDQAPPVLATLPGDVRVVHVGRLATEDARALAKSLADASGAVASDVDAIAAEADGHPLFIDELVRHAAVTRDGPAAPLRLDDALWRRVTRLDPGARKVLEIAAVLGAPATQEVVAHAAGLEMGQFGRAVSLLRTTNLVRTQGGRVTDTIEPFHDRVREAVFARLEPQVRRDCHAAIASALELAKNSDPEVLATHWIGAGEPATGGRYVIVAAEQAVQALAFERAARLFQTALELLPTADPRRRAASEQLGEALANAGDGARAAAAYTLAADGASPRDALDLRRRAAEQLLRAGRHVEGLEASRAVLSAIGIALPHTKLGALVALLWFRFLLRLRGVRFQPAALVSPDDLTRIDVCWAVSFTLPYADALTGAVFHARHLLLALRAGDTLRIARALAVEAAYLASARGVAAWPRIEDVLTRARTAADESREPYARAIVSGNEGIALCVTLRFTDSIAILEKTIATFREECPGSAWEVTTASFFLFISQSYTCRYRELRARHAAALRDAVEHNDRYAAVMLRIGILNNVWLFDNDPARARSELAAAMRAWPDGRFHTVHFHFLTAEGYIDLYEGEWVRAYERTRAALPAIAGSMLLHVAGVRLELGALRARIAVARAVSEQGTARERFIREAELAGREHERLGGSIGQMNTRVLRANVARLRGDAAEAQQLVEALAKDDGAEESWLSVQCARWLLGRLRGGDVGAAEVRAARGALAERDVRCDERVLRVFFPAFADLFMTPSAGAI
jgi:hypothetical protein